MTPESPETLTKPEAGALLPPATGSALPCPFCGGAAKIFTREVHDTTPEPRRKLYWYVCNTYQCGVGVTHGEWSEQRALEKWNRRTTAPNVADQQRLAERDEKVKP